MIDPSCWLDEEEEALELLEARKSRWTAVGIVLGWFIVLAAVVWHLT